MPSVDGVGRYFPLTVLRRARTAPDAIPPPELDPQDRWFERRRGSSLSARSIPARASRPSARTSPSIDRRSPEPGAGRRRGCVRLGRRHARDGRPRRDRSPSALATIRVEDHARAYAASTLLVDDRRRGLPSARAGRAAHAEPISVHHNADGRLRAVSDPMTLWPAAHADRVRLRPSRPAPRRMPGRVRSRTRTTILVLPEIGVWAVADGMGGHEAGSLASATVVDALRIDRRPASAPDLLARFEDRILRANARLRDDARASAATPSSARRSRRCCVFDGYYACSGRATAASTSCATAGSRSSSRDHTEAQELVDKGVLTPDEARTWPRPQRRHARDRRLRRCPSSTSSTACLEPGDIVRDLQRRADRACRDDEILRARRGARAAAGLRRPGRADARTRRHRQRDGGRRPTIAARSGRRTTRRSTGQVPMAVTSDAKPTQSRRTASAAGTRLNGIYEIERLIAVGGMGEVYKGRRHPDRRCGGDQDDPSGACARTRRRWRCSARKRRRCTTSSTRRSSATTCSRSIRMLGAPYLAMEFVDGQPLSEVLKQGPLGFEAVRVLQRRLAARPAGGARTRHRASRRVARQRHPAGGDVARAKIIDFGIARSTHARRRHGDRRRLRRQVQLRLAGAARPVRRRRDGEVGHLQPGSGAGGGADRAADRHGRQPGRGGREAAQGAGPVAASTPACGRCWRGCCSPSPPTASPAWPRSPPGSPPQAPPPEPGAPPS